MFSWRGRLPLWEPDDGDSDDDGDGDGDDAATNDKL